MVIKTGGEESPLLPSRYFSLTLISFLFYTLFIQKEILIKEHPPWLRYNREEESLLSINGKGSETNAGKDPEVEAAFHKFMVHRLGERSLYTSRSFEALMDWKITSFQDAFRYTGSKMVGMVYGSAMKAGEIKLNEALMQEAENLGNRLVKN